MPRRAKSPDEAPQQRPASTPDAREKQLMSLAVDLAEKQLREGTASAQVITHYLKLASSVQRRENEITELKKDLLKAKTESLQSAKRQEELFQNAIDAFRDYSGGGSYEE